MKRQIHLAALLLAAGRGHRFGSDKLITALPDGTPLAVATLRTLRDVVAEVIAVVHPRAAVTPLLAAEGARIVVAGDADRGLGHSIAAGVRALAPAADEPPRRPYDACLIALADMPLVRPSTVAYLIAALRDGATVVAPEYRGSRGHPVGFSGDWFTALAALEGDEGARGLLAVHRDRVLRVPVNDPGVLADVDRPSDLEALLSVRV